MANKMSIEVRFSLIEYLKDYYLHYQGYPMDFEDATGKVWEYDEYMGNLSEGDIQVIVNNLEWE